MSFSKVHSIQAELISAQKIDIEVDISTGLFSFNIIGLGDKAVFESKDRISSAIKYSGFKSPKQKNQKITISLAPADQKKSGTAFDLPMAIGYLVACHELNFDPQDKIFIGELSLDGEIRKINGIMQIVNFAKKNNFKEIFLPEENKIEASFIKGIKIYPARNLREIILHLNGEKTITDYQNNFAITNFIQNPIIDFSEIIGQEIAKRGLLIAGSGKHNIAFYGPPGTGKTMLARAFSEILPNLNTEKIIETTSIYSASGLLKNNLIIKPPFRSPHHTSSYAAILGGAGAKTGEITLAHNGVLFLDEMPEFDKRVINSLREPLEEKKINISRSRENLKYPADFILIATMNPCPCGYYQTGIKECVCLPHQIANYKRKISGPIIDRIDLWIEVNNIKQNEIIQSQAENTQLSQKYAQKILECQQIQHQRAEKLNGELKNSEILKLKINNEARKILLQVFEKYKLSMRSYYKIIKIAQTIADLENSEEIKKPHILEAVQFRCRN
jgi:magnesium chelatase family protein